MPRSTAEARLFKQRRHQLRGLELLHAEFGEIEDVVIETGDGLGIAVEVVEAMRLGGVQVADFVIHGRYPCWDSCDLTVDRTGPSQCRGADPALSATASAVRRRTKKPPGWGGFNAAFLGLMPPGWCRRRSCRYGGLPECRRKPSDPRTRTAHSSALERGGVDEDVLAAVIRLNEAEAFSDRCKTLRCPYSL